MSLGQYLPEPVSRSVNKCASSANIIGLLGDQSRREAAASCKLLSVMLIIPCFVLSCAQIVARTSWPQVTFSHSAPHHHCHSEETSEHCLVGHQASSRFRPVCEVSMTLCASPSHSCHSPPCQWQVRWAQKAGGSGLGLEAGDKDSNWSGTSGTPAKNACSGAQHKRCHGDLC